jgi:hypothetical protein
MNRAASLQGEAAPLHERTPPHPLYSGRVALVQQFVADRALLAEVGHECQVLAARKSSHRE